MKEIELTEKYKIENYNISQTYAQIANYYINQKKQKEALAAVEKAIATAVPLRNKYLPSGICKLLQQVRQTFKLPKNY